MHNRPVSELYAAELMRDRAQDAIRASLPREIEVPVRALVFASHQDVEIGGGFLAIATAWLSPTQWNRTIAAVPTTQFWVLVGKPTKFRFSIWWRWR